MHCEKCQAPHSGAYGSGRFCSSSCARSFSTTFLDNETIAKRGQSISKTLKGKPSNVKGMKLPPQSENAKKIINQRTEYRWKFGPWENIPPSRWKARILFEQGNCCDICKMPPIWMGKPLAFELDHTSGDRRDNSRGNLRMICSNCHRQTDTWGAKNAIVQRRRKCVGS
jgi:hypothetical protein